MTVVHINPFNKCKGSGSDGGDILPDLIDGHSGDVRVTLDFDLDIIRVFLPI